MTALGVTDAFVAKFAAGNGSLTWQKQFGSNEDNHLPGRPGRQPAPRVGFRLGGRLRR